MTVACSANSTGSSANGPSLSGKYIATTTSGPGFLSIDFTDATHYTVEPAGCTTTECAESGTYVATASSIVLTSATGVASSYALVTSQVTSSAVAGSSLHVLGGVGLGGGSTDASTDSATDSGNGGVGGSAAGLGGPSDGGSGSSLGGAGDGGVVLGSSGVALSPASIKVGCQAFSKWKVGLYTDSSYNVVSSEQTKLTAAGATGKLTLYLNYADFSDFVGGPDPNQHIASVSKLNSDGIQLVMAFQPTNAPFCKHASISAKGSNGCRMTDLLPTSPNAAALAALYAQIAAYADSLSQPLIFRFGSEMNANWDDWDYGYDKTNNAPKYFVEAWELAHHDIVTNLHKGKVLFAYAPNNNSYDGSTFAADIKSFWPGSANVDLIGLDGYTTTAGHTFSTDFGAQLSALEALGSQDLMLAEFACATTTAAHGQGGLVNRGTWLDGAVQVLAKHPRLHYMSWFDNDLSHTYSFADTDSTGQTLYAKFATDILGGSH